MASDDAAKNQDDEELQRLRTQLDALRARQHELELQRATMGIYTPPHITIELKQVTAEIDALKQRLDTRPSTAPVSIESGALAIASRPTVAQLRRTNLERRYAALAEEYDAVNKQIESALDSAQQVRLQRKADDILNEMQRVEDELQKLQ
jgi:molecular chaperone GrpE (heat shock protein)